MNNFIIVILGQKGSGKSELTKNSIIPYCPKPIFIYDKLEEYDQGVIYYDMEVLLDDYMEDKNKSEIYVFRPTNDYESELFMMFVRSIEAPCTIVFEEVDLLSSPQKIDKNLAELIKYGRHWSMNFVLISRRAAEMHRLITSQNDCIITFRQTELRDVDNLRKVSDAAGIVSELSKNNHEYIIIGQENLPKEFQHLLDDNHNKS